MYDLAVGKKVLITTDNWFYGPNGQLYRAVWGTVHAVLDSEQSLGVRTNRNSTNWYVHIGNMLVAGCQIHYALGTNTSPPGRVEYEKVLDDGHVVSYTLANPIYNADLEDTADE